MRITHARLGGWKVFPAPVDIPLATLPGTITAVWGANGAGKTTLATLITLGALYREGPGGQSPNALAAARDAHVEVTVQVGRDVLNLRQTFDAKGGGKALVTEAATGRPIDACRSGQIKEYGAWRAARLPDLDVAQAGIVLSQGQHGVLTLGDTERASVVLRALGAERLERLARAARDGAAAAEVTLKTTLGMLEAEAARSGDVDAATAALATARATLEAATVARHAAKAALAACEARAAAVQRHDAAKRRWVAITAKLAAAREVAAGAEAIRCAAREAAACDARIVALGQQQATAAQSVERAAAVAAAAEGAQAEAAARVQRSRERVEASEARATARRVEIDAATADMSVRLENNRRLLAGAAGIRAAASRLADIDAAIVALGAAQQQHREQADALAQRAGQLDGFAAEYGERAASWGEKRGDAEREAAACLQSVYAAQSALPEARATVARLAAEAAAALAQTQGQRAALATSWERRHAKLATFTRAVLGGAPVMPAAARVLDNDAAMAAEAAALPDAVRAGEVAHVALTQAHADAVRDVQRLEAIAARVEALAQHDGAAALCATQEAAARADLARVQAERAEVTEAVRVARAAASQAEQELARLGEERPALEARARYANRLDAAEERVADIMARLAEAERDLTRVQAEADSTATAEASEQRAAQALAEQHGHAAATARARQREAEGALLGHGTALTAARAQRERLGDTAAGVERLAAAESAMVALGPAEAEAGAEVREALAVLEAVPDAPAGGPSLEAAEQGERDAVAAVTRAEGELGAAVRGAATVATLGAKRREQEVALCDMRELAVDLGRRGIQADLVDGAAPTLTALTNELLRAAGVTRWTVRFATAKARKDGAEVVAFPLMVRDETTGEERDGRTFSGGEKVLIDSAASNAVAALACQRAGIDGAVLVRDEVGAALDATNERAWMAMLRRMVAMTGASRVLVITHSPTMRAMCDSALEVGGGAVREVDPAA